MTVVIDLVERRQLGPESIFDLPRIDFSQAVLGAQGSGVPRRRHRQVKQFP